MARRSSAASASSALLRAYQRSLRAAGGAVSRAVVRAVQDGQRAARKAGTPAALQRPPPGPGDWLSGMTLGPAGARAYHLYRPPALAAARAGRAPLLVMLHGCKQNGRDFAASTRMNRLAARHGFLVLYPEQDRLHHAQGCWSWYALRSGKARAEAATLMTMIDQVVRLYAGDAGRVAVAGFSAGAGMAALLAMLEPARFQAVAMHAGVAPGAAQSQATALAAMQGRRAPAIDASVGASLPPLLVIQGERDAVVASATGIQAAAAWAVALDAQPAPPRRLQRGQRYPMWVTDFRRTGQTWVTLCQIAQLGHAWSGGTRQDWSDPKGPDASALVWAFVQRQFARVATGGRAPGH